MFRTKYPKSFLACYIFLVNLQHVDCDLLLILAQNYIFQRAKNAQIV